MKKVRNSPSIIFALLLTGLYVFPLYVEAADKAYHLGISDLNRIDIKAIGWTEGLLV